MGHAIYVLLYAAKYNDGELLQMNFINIKINEILDGLSNL